MKRNKVTEIFSQDKALAHKQRIAFHEAGHAAGIHLNNKARQLPPVFFKIIFKEISAATEADDMAYQTVHDDCIARVKGGRLIQSLAPSVDSLVRGLPERIDITAQWVNDYMTAFEADIINLLIGPLAEAKYVADSDNELFNHRLVNLDALKNYGGGSDIALANEYLHSLCIDKQQKDNKLNELFTEAFNFINTDANWVAITKLADYILGSHKNTIHCEEIVSTLDYSIAHFHNRLSIARRHCHG